MRARRGKPIFLIDIAVPRDIDPRVNTLENVYLYDIDDLQAVVSANLREREQEAEKAKLILDEQIKEFHVWFKTQEVVPFIAALRQKAESIRQVELERSIKRLSNLSDKEIKHVDNLTRAIVNRILREPVLRIKELALEDRSDMYVTSLCRLFDLDESAPVDAGQPDWRDDGIDDVKIEGGSP
jgi:glutamyl-tRNA reductase